MAIVAFVIWIAAFAVGAYFLDIPTISLLVTVIGGGFLIVRAALDR